MKTLYEIMGFTGFFIVLAGAGCNEDVSFWKAMIIMLFGFSLMLLSSLFMKLRILRLRKRRRKLYTKRIPQTLKINADSTESARNIPEGISLIISGKINSLELC